MLIPRLARLGALIVVAVSFSSRLAASEDPRTALRFLQELRAHDLHDLALEFIDLLRADPGLAVDVKVVLDYQEGRTLIDEASRTGDLVRRRELLDQARTRLQNFSRDNPQHPLTRETLVQVARMQVERGHLSLLLAGDATDPALKNSRQVEARAAMNQGKEAYAQAVAQLDKLHKSFAGFIPKGDPRLEERSSVYSALLDAMLQKAVTEYELAQTYPAGSAERNTHLTKALGEFDALYKDYRTQLAGLAAQMWQAKCYEEQGKIGEAIGIYKALLDQTAPELRPLQRIVGYFHIVALSKRKQHALAADEAVRWLQKYSRQEQRSQEGLGVLLELAKNLDAQLGEDTDKAEHQHAVKRITDAVTQVVRYTSPYKQEALALLKKYRPTTTARLEDLAKLSYDDAMTQADEAISAHDWEHAIGLYKAAIRKVDPRRDIDRLNRARYNLSFCYYMNKSYYEATVLAEHLARRYPQGGLSPKAVEIAMQSLAEAYNTYGEVDRGADLEGLIGLAKYAAATWPDRDQGDDAHLNLGQIYQGRGQFDEAIAEFGAMRDRSPKKLEGQTRLGGAHWLKSRMLERKGDKAQAAAEAQAAIDLLDKTLKARQGAGATAVDPGLITNAADLAVALTETGKPTEALAILEPIRKAQTSKSGAPYSRLMEASLLAQINSGQIEPAIASMKALEESGAAGSRAQLYFKLGKLLEKELDRLREGKQTVALQRMQKAYRSFLTALTESKSGQTYESLQWAGESLLSIGAADEAEKVFRRVLSESTGGSTSPNQTGADEQLMRTKLKLSAALRSQKKFEESESLIDEIQSKYKQYLEPLVEKGMLLESQAEAGKGSWSAALGHWQVLAQRLSRMRPRPLAYYDAWYHAAVALHGQNEEVKARQTLKGIMRLNPEVGGPEMKARYEALLARLK